MRFLSTLLARNWTLKLAAFVLALLLWVVVQMEKPERREFADVPVRVEMNDPEWALVGEALPTGAMVRLAGPARQLLRLGGNRPSIIVPVDEVTSADTSLAIDRNWVRLQGIEDVVVEEIQPGVVVLAFEPMTTVAVAVVPTHMGELPPGLSLAAPLAVDPASISVIGPASRLDDLPSIMLQPVDFADVEESGAVRVGVDRSALADLRFAPDTLSVSVLVESSVERVVGVPVTGASRSLNGFEFLPETMPVTLIGAPSVVDRVNPEQLRVIVAGDEFLDLPLGGQLRLPVHLEGVPDLTFGSPHADSVTVRRVAAEQATEGAEFE